MKKIYKYIAELYRRNTYLLLNEPELIKSTCIYRHAFGIIARCEYPRPVLVLIDARQEGGNPAQHVVLYYI